MSSTAFFLLTFLAYLLGAIGLIWGGINFFRKTSNYAPWFFLAIGGLIVIFATLHQENYRFDGFSSMFAPKQVLAQKIYERTLWNKFGPAREEIYVTCAEPGKWAKWSVQDKDDWEAFNLRILHNTNHLAVSILGEGCYARN